MKQDFKRGDYVVRIENGLSYDGVVVEMDHTYDYPMVVRTRDAVWQFRTNGIKWFDDFGAEVHHRPVKQTPEEWSVGDQVEYKDPYGEILDAVVVLVDLDLEKPIVVKVPPRHTKRHELQLCPVDGMYFGGNIWRIRHK